jgi:hypothetical protein
LKPLLKESTVKDAPKNRLKSNNLRKRAEDFLKKTPSAIKKLPTRDVNDLKSLVEELQTHQVELEMQDGRIAPVPNGVSGNPETVQAKGLALS